MKKFAYGAKHRDWALKNYSKYCSYKQLTQDFNAHFGERKSTVAVQQFLTKSVGVYLRTPKKSEHFTKAEETWLVENYDNHETYPDMTAAFNAEFCREKSVEAVRDKCTKRLALRGKKNPTSYKKGNLKAQCPIGTVRKNCGYTYIKVKDSAHSFQNGYEDPYWLPLQKKVWVDHYGDVPAGKMVIFLDCNQENFDIENLYCIDRSISAVLANNGWYSTNRELTLTAIKWCELFFALKKGAL
jgi:hypothetical protein